MAQNFKKYNFKSVGKSMQEVKELTLNEKKEMLLGFKTPLEFGFSNDGLLKMHTNLANQVADNFRNMLLTNHGERLGIYNFGANLRDLLFELGAADADAEAMTRISNATANFMPYIVLKEFIPNIVHDGEAGIAIVKIQIVYDLPLLDSFNRSIELTLFTAG
jgi:phage baseplate assembly protein W